MEISREESKGSLVGSSLMIAGCCIGAGMIGLPAITAFHGFIPSILLLLFSWAFMISTGLLMLEVNLLFPKSTNLLTMAQSVIGRTGKHFTSLLFTFLFISLLIAYLSGTGSLVANFLSLIIQRQIPEIYGNILCTLFVILLLMKGTGYVDWMNRGFLFCMILSYGLLLFLGVQNIRLDYLQRAHYSPKMVYSLPILLVSFGYQNLIPSITTYLEKNKSKIQLSIIIGCSIPFLVYLLWELIILGMLSSSDVSSLISSGDQNFISSFFQKTTASSHLVFFIEIFSLFALLTSLITVGLSFHDFLKDQLKTRLRTSMVSLIPIFILIPALILSILIPNLFIKGLSLAGGLGAVLLFGLLPVIMSWKVRYHPDFRVAPILPGGKPILITLFFLSLLIFGVEFTNTFIPR